jgi:hypothetical protein
MGNALLNTGICNAVNTVYSTYDYSKFSKMQGNRNINPANLNNIIVSLSKKNLPIPIVVNERFEIVDGQHRFEALISLKLPIYFIVVAGINLSDCVLLNTVSAKWSSETFLYSYSDRGYTDYLMLKSFIEKNKIKIERALIFFFFDRLNGDRRQAFRSGDFKVTDIEKTNRFYQQYLDFGDCPAFENLLFAGAVVQLFKNPEYNHARMKEKLKYQSYKLKVRSFMVEYHELLLDVYNYKVSLDKKLKI